MSPLSPDESAALVRALAPGLSDDEVAAIVVAASGRPGIITALADVGDPLHTLAAVLASIGSTAATAVTVAHLAGGWLPDDETAAVAGVDLDVWSDAARPRHPRTVRAAIARRGAVVGSVGRRGTTDDRRCADAARGSCRRCPRRPRSSGDRRERAGSRPVATSTRRHPGSWPQTRPNVSWRSLPPRSHCGARSSSVGATALLRLGRRAGELSLAAGDREDADRLAERLLPRLERHAVSDAIGVRMLRYRARSEAGLAGADEQLDAALLVDAPPCREHVDALVVDALRCVLTILVALPTQRGGGDRRGRGDLRSGRRSVGTRCSRPGRRDRR